MNLFNNSLVAFCFMSLVTLCYGNVDSVLMQQEIVTNPHDNLGFFVRFSVDEETYDQPESSVDEQEEPSQEASMFDVLRIVLSGCADLYLSLDDNEKDDVIKMAAELLTLQSMVVEYCDTCLKYNDLMVKYKQFRNIDTMSIHASIGCQGCNDTAYDEAPFILEIFLKDPTIQEFYMTLDRHEQKQYRRIVRGMEDFCHDVIKTIEIITDHYPSLKAKTKSYLDIVGLSLMLTVRFDHPFPSATYQVL